MVVTAIRILKKIVLLHITIFLKNLFFIMKPNMNEEPKKFRFDWISFVSGLIAALASAFGITMGL